MSTETKPTPPKKWAVIITMVLIIAGIVGTGIAWAFGLFSPASPKKPDKVIMRRVADGTPYATLAAGEFVCQPLGRGFVFRGADIAIPKGIPEKGSIVMTWGTSPPSTFNYTNFAPPGPGFPFGYTFNGTWNNGIPPLGVDIMAEFPIPTA